MLAAAHPEVKVRYLDQGLHRTPQRMAPLVQAEIDAHPGFRDVVLGSGLCSNGIVGVKAGPAGLHVPKAHDCIALFLGSLAAYKAAFEARPGTYYLTPGWVAEGKDPLSIIEQEYEPKFGRETAVWVMAEELKNYTHVTLIASAAGDIEPVRRRARENAAFLGKAYDEAPGLMDYFRKLMLGPWDPADFFHIAPGETITQDRYMAEALASV